LYLTSSVCCTLNCITCLRSIEGPEVTACVQKVLGLAGISNVPQGAIDSVFARVAGPDQKLDRTEFAALVKQLLGHLQGQQ
jgi:hypothetical protein